MIKFIEVKQPYFLFSGGLKAFLLKVKELILVGFLFAGVIVLTNLGLDKASININVLLRTSSIFWIILLSFLIRSERPTLLQVMFALIVTSGAILLSLDVGLGWSVHVSNIPAVVVNLASALCTGLMFVTMRFVVSRQEKYEHLRMNILEMTMVKMFIAALFMLIPALVMETILPFADSKPTVWQVMFTRLDMFGLVLGGVLVTLIFQSSVLALTVYSKAISVGLIQQFLIFPQLAFYTIISAAHLVPRSWNIQLLKPTWSHITGSCLIIVGTLLYAVLRVVKMLDQKRRRKEHEKVVEKQKEEDEEVVSLLRSKDQQESREAQIQNLPRKWYDWIV
ncbi:hypothetical protein C9374_000994 [Naegleria lovaniensis]|uniref:Uncharacterized protein n=1 Tax=Naegleria lovaniensis TaxID=51637 RepID=A0AA88GYR1_NAELO|nr:uncharacterized protein C9374_000994 [Naegleria lovaniensis]KAG2388144.1 hypothetical protein C9374_000994 [Naegleria lovaniensis]